MDIFTLLLILIVIGLITYYFFYRMSYFDRIGIPYDKPVPILGNMIRGIFRIEQVSCHLQRLYNRYSDYKYFGFFEFMNPVIVIRDPELIQSITVRNFDNFTDHRGFADDELDPLMAKNLFSLRGEHWREMRKVLSPVFTSSKMKVMYGLMYDCAERFTGYLVKDAKDGKEIEAGELLSRYTNDVIATTAFGIEVDSMRDQENDFFMTGKEAFNFNSVLSIKFLIGQNFRYLMKLFSIRLFSKKIQKFFEDIIGETVKVREEKGIVRPDMIQMMMETKGKSSNRNLSISEMTCQAFIFFFAGFHTVSTTMAFMVYELSLKPDIKKKLCAEIEEVVKESNGRPSYEKINQMKYMDAVIKEVMRMYPQGSLLDRLCVKEFDLPPAVPGGRPVKVKPGDTVWLPVYSIHRDPQYYPQPDKFDPERFLDTDADQTAFYMPFGVGPRFCIGNRFALMEMKILAFNLLTRCDLTRSSKATLPVEYSKKSMQLMPKSGFWVKIKARQS